MKPFDWLKAWPLYPIILVNSFWCFAIYQAVMQQSYKFAAALLACVFFAAPQLSIWFLAKKYYTR